MGAWGTGNLENDTALDWINAFVENPSGKRLQAFFNQSLEADNYGEEILAAAEVVAAWNGHPPSDLFDEALKWLRVQKKAPTAKLLESAHHAVTKVLEQSELRSLWSESAYFEEWQKVIQDLLARLRAEYKSPQKARKKPEKRIWPPRLGLNQTRGIVTSTAFCNLRKDNLPLRSIDITGVEIDLGQDYTVEELERIAAWATAEPCLMIILRDLFRSLGFRINPEAIRCFSNSHRLTLRLETLKSLQPFFPFPNLRQLVISHMNQIKNWTELGQLTYIRHIALGALKTLTSIEPLAHLQNLRALQLQSLPALKTLAELALLPNLKGLFLSGFDDTIPLPDLSQLSCLTHLEISLRGSADIRAIAQLPALRELSLSSPPEHITTSEFAILSGHPTLKYINVNGFGWKRKMDEINAILGTEPLDVDSWPDFTE